MGKTSRRKQQRKSNPPALVQAATNSLRPAPPKAAAPLGPLSAAIIEIIEPYKHAADTLETYKALAGLATLAWNLTLMPEAEREARIADAARELKPSDGVDVQEVIQALCWRKNSLFPHDKRVIVGCDVTTGPNGYRVIVTFARAA